MTKEKIYKSKREFREAFGLNNESDKAELNEIFFFSLAKKSFNK
jgi:hypothetical protein